jgi:SAM-dependent methyltransferase
MTSHSDNPWRSIPAQDYEAHMASPEVGQLQFLNAVFKEILARQRPESLLVPGCATGNGFEHIDFAVTKRVVAVDINPKYLALLRKRFLNTAQYIETVDQDILVCEFAPASFDLIFAGLIFEYLDAAAALARFRTWLISAGILVAVLQLPDDRLAPVTETPFPSLQALAPVMKLMTSEAFDETAAAHGFIRIEGTVRRLTSGKRMHVATYSPR